MYHNSALRQSSVCLWNDYELNKKKVQFYQIRDFQEIKFTLLLFHPWKQNNNLFFPHCFFINCISFFCWIIDVLLFCIDKPMTCLSSYRLHLCYLPPLALHVDTWTIHFPKNTREQKQEISMTCKPKLYFKFPKCLPRARKHSSDNDGTCLFHE